MFVCSCSYDFLTIREDEFEDASNLTDAAPPATDPELTSLGLEGHVVVGRGRHRYCGDWSEKLKLLRYPAKLTDITEKISQIAKNKWKIISHNIGPIHKKDEKYKKL